MAPALRSRFPGIPGRSSLRRPGVEDNVRGGGAGQVVEDAVQPDAGGADVDRLFQLLPGRHVGGGDHDGVAEDRVAELVMDQQDVQGGAQLHVTQRTGQAAGKGDAAGLFLGRHGFHLAHVDANDFHDRWGTIHARQLHPSFYDPARLHLSQTGVDYLLPIFSNAVGPEDMESVRQSLFNSGNLTRPYHSVNTDINKRIRYLE